MITSNPSIGRAATAEAGQLSAAPQDVNEIIYHFVKDADHYAVYKDEVREPSRYQGHDQTCKLCNSTLPGRMDKHAWKYNPKGRDPGNVIYSKGATGQELGGYLEQGDEAPQEDIHPALMPMGWLISL